MGLFNDKKGAGLRPFTISLMFVILFTFFILSFSGNFIMATNPNSEVLNSKYGLNQSIQLMNDSIDDYSALSTDVYTQLKEGKPSALDYVFLIFQGAFYIPISFLDFIFAGLVSLTSVLFPSLAGTGGGAIVAIVIGVLFSSLVITIVLLIVSAIRTGVSER